MGGDGILGSIGSFLFGKPKQPEVPKGPTEAELAAQKAEAEAKAKAEAEAEEAAQKKEAEAKAKADAEARAKQQGRAKSRINVGSLFDPVETKQAKLKAKLGQ